MVADAPILFDTCDGVSFRFNFRKDVHVKNGSNSFSSSLLCIVAFGRMFRFATLVFKNLISNYNKDFCDGNKIDWETKE